MKIYFSCILYRAMMQSYNKLRSTLAALHNTRHLITNEDKLNNELYPCIKFRASRQRAEFVLV